MCVSSGSPGSRHVHRSPSGASAWHGAWQCCGEGEATRGGYCKRGRDLPDSSGCAVGWHGQTGRGGEGRGGEGRGGEGRGGEGRGGEGR